RRVLVWSGALAIAAGWALAHGIGAESAQARGKYLVQLGGCTDCHTPGHFFGRPDMARFLGGSDLGIEAPGLGIFIAPNLTPDNDGGRGPGTKDDIVPAIRTGVRPAARILAPIMPWRGYAALTTSDAGAIAEYLRSLPPVTNKVPGPFGPDEKPPVFRMTIVPPSSGVQPN